MNERLKTGPHHSSDTDGGNTILVEITAEMVPHDSPEFIEHARKGRPPGSPPIPDYLRAKPKPGDGPPTTS